MIDDDLCAPIRPELTLIILIAAAQGGLYFQGRDGEPVL